MIRSTRAIILALSLLAVAPAFAQNGIGYSYPRPAPDARADCFRDAPPTNDHRVHDDYIKQCLGNIGAQKLGGSGMGTRGYVGRCGGGTC